jgi:hypothetical protein
MAAPNLKSPTTITGKTTTYTCTTTLTSVLSNSAASGKLLKVNTIRAANTTTNGATIDLTVFRSAAHTYIIEGPTVAPYTSFVALNKEEYLYLEEGDALYAKASANSSIDLIVNYEEIS